MLGTTLLWAGKFADARTLLEQRQRLSLTMEKRSALAFTYDALASAYLHLGDYRSTHKQALLNISTARQVDNRR